MPKINSLVHKISCIAFLCCFLVALSSCGGDDDSPDFSEITGTWTGTRYYENPVSGIKSNSLEVTFNSDKTGEITYEGVTIFSYGKFQYSFSGNTISCRGVWANTNEDVDLDFTISFRIEGERLIPIDRYQNFILTRDGSVSTNGDGEEIVDNSELLPGVWVKIDKSAVLELFSSDTYTLYKVDPDDPDSYLSDVSGSYYYDAIRSLLVLGNVRYELRGISSEALYIYNTETGRLDCYERGSSKDIPEQPDIKSYLNKYLVWSTKNTDYVFSFFSNGSVQYFENTTVKVNYSGTVTLSAKGTYSVSGKTITCRFTDVYWENGQDSKYANIFPGWVYDKPCTKTYTVKKISDTNLWLECEDGSVLKMTP